LERTAGREELIAALRLISAGGRSLPSQISARLAGLKLGPATTLREREILPLIAKGGGNREIAAAFGIAEDTVKRHIGDVLRRFGLSDRAQATSEAIRRGIVRAKG
jgi:DNA-binding NarL/FixJ family response regulator